VKDLGMSGSSVARAAARQLLAERAAEAAAASSPRAALYALRALRRELETFERAREPVEDESPANATGVAGPSR
jgi:hypothetical protein